MLAHGIGERGELPIPAYLVTWGVAAALVLAFVTLGSDRSEPRLIRASTGRALLPYRPRRPLALIHRMAQAVALAIHLTCVAAAFVGFDAADRNLLPVTLYVVLWVGGQLVAGLLGDVWAAINPVATLARGAEGLSVLVGRRPAEGPTRWGHWPAVAGLAVLLFHWLSHPRGLNPRTLAWAVGAHTAVTVVAGFAWGSRWVVDHEPFSVLLSRLGAMAPLFDRRSEPDSIDLPADAPGTRRWAEARGADGPDRRDLGWRSPLSGLASMEVRPGTAALLLVGIGGMAFDGFSESELGQDLLAGLYQWRLAWAELGMMIAAISMAAMLYLLGVWWIDRVTGLGFDRAWNEFAPTLVPVVFAFVASHYVKLFIEETQSFWFRLSDPFGRGWDLFGGSDGLVWRLDPDIVVWVQVAAILFGHLAAIVVANDRAIELFRPPKAFQAQLALLFVIVAYSALALWLLLSA